MIDATSKLLRRVVGFDPAVILIDLENPSRDVLEDLFTVLQTVHRPIGMFVALVEIHAAELSEEMTERLARGDAAGALIHSALAFLAVAPLEGAAPAVCDASDEAAAGAFAAAARAAGVTANVIDRPAHCTFPFGSIVNRSPVVVAS